MKGAIFDNPEHRMKGAIFDLDGTLLDSMGVWEQIDIDFLRKRGLEVPADYLEIVTPMGFRSAAEYTIERFQLREQPDELMAEWEDMAVRAYSETVQLKPFAKELLHVLREHGIRLGIATASSASLYIPALRCNEIYDLFESFTTLAEVERGKGFPDIYLKAAQKLDLKPSECVVFEDIYAGIVGARAGGFQTVGVYDPYSDFDQQKMRETADRYIESFKDILSGSEDDGVPIACKIMYNE